LRKRSADRQKVHLVDRHHQRRPDEVTNGSRDAGLKVKGVRHQQEAVCGPDGSPHRLPDGRQARRTPAGVAVVAQPETAAADSPWVLALQHLARDIPRSGGVIALKRSATARTAAPSCHGPCPPAAATGPPSACPAAPTGGAPGAPVAAPAGSCPARPNSKGSPAPCTSPCGCRPVRR